MNIPKEIPTEMLNDYTLNGQIPILHTWIDGSKELLSPIWTNEYIATFTSRFKPDLIKNNMHGEEPYYAASYFLLMAFEKYNIRNKKVAIIGSTTPWIEAILLNLGNQVTTVEYNVPTSTNTQITCTSFWDFCETKELYDCIVTYSSIEHSGLGRYGDPLDPYGDIKTMETIHQNLKTNGILIWGAPIGHDALVWNAHRIYGNIRLPLMFTNFKELEWLMHDKSILNRPLSGCGLEPVIVLQAIDWLYPNN